MSNNIDIGSFLKEIRDKHGMTQSEFADVLKISRTTYSNYEQNLREPNLATLSILAKEFDLDLNKVIAGKDINNSFNPDKDFLNSLTTFFEEFTKHEIENGNAIPYFSGDEEEYLLESFYYITKALLKYRNHLNPKARFVENFINKK